jgi:Tol biopolymer transport system component
MPARTRVTRILSLAVVGAVTTVAAGSATGTVPRSNGVVAFDRVLSTDPNTGATRSSLWITTGRGGARRIAGLSSIQAAVDASWSPDGRVIAFAADCSFKYRLSCSSVWRVNTDGSGLRKLSNGDAQDYCPAWSPRGTRIAFTAEFAGTKNRSSGIYVMNADGSSRRAIDRNELDGCVSWSPDGSRLAFWRPNRLMLIRADGGGEQTIARDVGAYDAEPDWSPDGAHLVLAKHSGSSSRLYLIRPDGTELHPVAVGSSPAWSPDGRELAFARGGEIYSVPAGGGRAVRLTRERMRTAARPAWQPR